MAMRSAMKSGTDNDGDGLCIIWIFDCPAHLIQKTSVAATIN